MLNSMSCEGQEMLGGGGGGWRWGGGVGYGKNVGMLTDIELHCYSLVVASSS